MERATLEINPPRDKLKIIYFILLLHGIGTLMPWNMFINAKSVSLHSCNILSSIEIVTFLFFQIVWQH